MAESTSGSAVNSAEEASGSAEVREADEAGARAEWQRVPSGSATCSARESVGLCRSPRGRRSRLATNGHVGLRDEFGRGSRLCRSPRRIQQRKRRALPKSGTRGRRPQKPFSTRQSPATSRSDEALRLRSAARWVLPCLADQRPRASARFTMRGVMKITSSLRVSLARRRWKRTPRIGMSPKNGTWSRFRPVLRVKMPPMTAV